MKNKIQSKTNENKAIIAVLLGNSIFGLSFLFSKLALEITIPSVLIAVRFSVAFLVLNIIVLVGRKIKKADGTPLVEFSLKGKPKKDILLLSLFQPVIYYVAENYGIVYTSSAFAGVIIAVIPVAGVIFDMLIMHSKVSAKQIIFAVFSVVGVAITTLGAENMTSSVKGVIFLLIAVVASAMFYVFSKKSGDSYNAIERTYVMFLIGSIFYIILSVIQCYGHYDTLVFSALAQPTFWYSIIYLSVVSSVIAFLLLNYGSSRISISRATIFANITTVISIIAGVLVLGESFTIGQIIGAVIIIVSVYLAQ